MRNVIKKIIVILFLALMLINNSLLLLVANAVDEIRSLIDESKVKALTEVNLEKYVNYNLDDENKGLMLQLDLKSGIEYEEGQEYVPIKSTGMNLKFPKINDEFPERVEIVGLSTKATNGDDNAKDWQHTYNSENGELRLVAVNNEDDDGNIYSENVENSRDEYRVIAYYSKNCYSQKVDKSNIEFDGEIQINLVNDDATQISSKIEKDFDVEDDISGLISEEVVTDDIFKGYIYSNSKNSTNYETVFNETAKLDISYKEIADEIYFLNTDQFTYKDGNTVDTDDVIYKNTKINKNEVLEILGEEGKLEVLDKQGNVLLEINKDTETSEYGIVEVNYENEVTGLTVKTTKPISIGTITINNIKAIKPTMVDVNVSGIKTNIEISCKSEIITEQEAVQQSEQDIEQDIEQKNEQVKEQKEIYQFRDEKVIELKEPETKIEAKIDNIDWLNYTNNNVNFNLTLLSNENRYDLFEKPIIEIKLPEQVEKVVLGDVHPLYGENLSIKAAVVLDRDNTKVIRIELDGAQSEYFSNSMIEGTNIVVPATIIMKKDISDAQANVELTYTNANATSIDYINETKTSKEYGVNIITGTISNELEKVSESEENKLYSSAMPSGTEQQESGESKTEPQQNMISADIKATVGKKQLQNNDEVYEEQIIKYTVKLKNITDKKIENINIIGNIPEGTHFATVDYGTDYETSHDTYDLYKYVTDDSKTEWNANNINLDSGAETELYYEVKVSKLVEGETEKAIKSDIKVNIGDSNSLQYSLNNIIKKAEISVELKSTVPSGGDNLIVYNVYIFNNLDVDINNVKVDIELPEELKYVEEPDEILGTTIEGNNNKVEIKIDSIKANSVLANSIFTSLKETNDKITQYEPKVVAVVSADNINNVYNSNENRIKAYTSGIEILQTSAREGEDIKYGEEVEYDIIIKNTSNENYEEKAYNISVKDYIDENLEFSRIEYEYFEENSEGIYEKKSSTDEMDVIDSKENEDNTSMLLNLETVLPIGETIKIKLVLNVGAVFDRTEVSNKVDVIYGNKTKSSNVIKNNILPFSDSDGVDDPDASDPNDENKERYNISGIAWMDENRDGQMNADEKRFPNITVKLFNADTGSIVKDDKGNNIQTTTDDNGKYEFENIEKGKYLVIFIYDNSKYTTTTYKQSGVNESANSNVIEKEASIDNNKLIVAASDIIEINSADRENINIGLVEKVKFDLSLDKTITKVSTTYNGKTNEKEYKATKLAKVEIPAKQISNTKLIVEYQIEVKNEGNIDAYVDEIIDYIPKGLEFNIELNSDWIETSDGNVKNISLTGKKIAPGESQIVKLNLIKSTSSNLTGTIKNGAEILKTSNLSGASDIDSVAGNKNRNEDDYSEAELIVSIKTGAVAYTLIILVIIIILIILKVLVDKKIINIKNFKMLLLLTIIVGLISCVDYSRAYTPKAITEAEIKKELAEAYKNEVVHLRYGVGYVHYKHSHSIGQLYCSDGNSMCSHEDHKYVYSGIRDYKKTKTETQKPINFEKVKLTKSDSAAKVKKLNSENSIAGPFKIGYDEEKVKTKVISVIADGKTLEKNDDYVITNKEGNERVDIESRTPFYIKIRNPNVKNVTIKITGTGEKYHTETKYKITYKEIWRCTGTCNYSDLHKPQVMWKDMEKEGEEIIDKPNEKTVTLTAGNKETPPPPETDDGALVLQKVDDRDTDIPLENVGFIFSTQVNVYEWYGSYDHYHWVTYEGTDFVLGPGGILIPIPVTYSKWEYWWTENYYHWVTKTMYLNSNYQWTESRGSAKVFYTDDEGMISVPTLKLPENTYVINEGTLGNNYYQPQEYVNTDVLAIEVDNRNYGYNLEIGKTYTITRHEAGYTEDPKVLENHQKYVKLSGYVWIDGHDGKATVRNDLYDTGEEPGFNGIQVYLKNSYGNTIKTTQTSELGLYTEINGGEYQFSEVDLDELQAGSYHIEFEYNGLIYEAVASNIYDETGSKADDTDSRNNLDNAFERVDGNGSQTLNMQQGIKVNYSNINSGEHRSEIAGSENTNVIASTYNAGYDLYENFEPKMEEIRYINFGVYEKVQADYALTKDLYNVRIDVNGKSHIYRYGTRRYQQKENSYEKGQIVDENSSWNMGVKFQNMNGKYKRAIYQADAEFKLPGDPDKELKVFATYKIALKNESSHLGRINSIIDYCDQNFELRDAGLTLEEEHDRIWNNKAFNLDGSYRNDKYKKYVVNTDIEIYPGETEFIYLQFEIKKDAILTLMNNGELLNNVAEINSYTTFRDDAPNLPLAVVDKDSVPGNVIPGNIGTYEDDTDAALSLQLEVANARAVDGTVFVDTPSKFIDKEKLNEVNEGKERIGNGKFDNGETTLGKIPVTLKENSGSGKVYKTETVDSPGKYGYILEQRDDGTNYFKPELYNENNRNQYAYVSGGDLNKGDFLISNYIPGDYTLTYTWGDNDYKVQYYKGTIYYENRSNKQDETRNKFWYRGSEYGDDIISQNDSYMDAFDDAERRKAIDGEMTNVDHPEVTTNILESEINKAYTTEESNYIAITSMDSITPNMEFSVEYDTTVTDGTLGTDRVTFTVKNIDFGIVERPKQKLQLSKEVEAFKITLANGQVLVDATINEVDGVKKLEGVHNYTTYMGPINGSSGMIKMEVDNELIEGATLEVTYKITVTNIGEIDYVSDRYYYYGNSKDYDNSKNADKVKVSVTELIDYLDRRLAIKERESDWQENGGEENDKQYLDKVNARQKDEVDYLNKRRTFITEGLSSELEPGQSNSLEMKVSKLLTSTDDNTFTNDAEIARVVKNNTPFASGTPVKVNELPDKTPYFEFDPAENVVIIPSTGENKDYLLITIIGITSLAIIGLGAFGIKKFVIDR